VVPTADGLQLQVFRDGVLIATASSDGRVKIHGLGGHDTIEAEGSITADLWFDGGSGNDRLKGAHGNDVLLGGEGDDLLVGKSGRDLLVGGMGADRIVGNADDDILIGGRLDFGTTPIATAISYVMAEWTSARTYGQRISNITDGSGTAERENESFFLQWLNTVQDDQDEDVLTGSSGADWFFANSDIDRVTDLKDEAFADEWEFINE
jgi:Ca2+-binding RTX toxin-like protein